MSNVHFSTGYFAYIETSAPRVRGDFALLGTPANALDVYTSIMNVTFYYHMNGADIGTLEVIEINQETKTVWEMRESRK